MVRSNEIAYFLLLLEFLLTANTYTDGLVSSIQVHTDPPAIMHAAKGKIQLFLASGCEPTVTSQSLMNISHVSKQTHIEYSMYSL